MRSSGRQVSEFDHGALRVYESIPDATAPIFLFVHGGPGSHCHYFKKVVTDTAGYQTSNLGWVFYDQRGCGKSKSATGVTHADNADDLRELLKSCLQKYGDRLAGVVGHSYGGWLAYDVIATLTKEMDARSGEALPPAILLGINVDRTISRNRNFMIEMIEAKIRAADDYQAFLSQLPAEHFADAWREKDRLRSVKYSRDLRKFFYWANLDAMADYEKLKTTVDVAESDEIFLTVRDSFFAPPIPTVDLSRLPAGSLRVVGFQDFMMAGEAASADPHTSVFLRSGHYPHIEQPEEFLALLSQVAGRR